MRIVALLFAVCFLFAGCATTYHPYEGTTGYVEMDLGDDMYTVCYTANIHTSEKKIRQMVLRRAAELTLEKGFSHFSIRSEENIKDMDLCYQHTRFKTCELTILLLNGKATSSTINAREYLNIAI